MKYLLSILTILSISSYLYAQRPATRNDSIFIHYEMMPQYPEGDVELLKFISNNLVYPTDSTSEGRVITRFVISETGDVQDASVVYSSLGKAFDEEAIRVVKLMPKWTPGTMNGIPKDIHFTLPIIFKLPENK